MQTPYDHTNTYDWDVKRTEHYIYSSGFCQFWPSSPLFCCWVRISRAWWENYYGRKSHSWKPRTRTHRRARTPKASRGGVFRSSALHLFSAIFNQRNPGPTAEVTKGWREIKEAGRRGWLKRMSKSLRSKQDFKRKSIFNDARNSVVNTSVLNKHFYLPSYARGSIPGRCALFSYKNTEAWGNRCSPSLRKHQASSFVWTRNTFQQLPLLNVSACLHTKAPLWLDYSLSHRTWWPQAVETCGAVVQLRVLAGCGARLSAADVMKHDYVFGWRSGKGGAFPSGCNNH